MMKSRNGIRSGSGKIVRACCRLTPHPGPLPVEGRGGAASDFVLGDAQSRARFVLVVPAEMTGRKQARRNASRSRHPSIATPSPLNEERAGVRGEAVRCASPSRILNQIRAVGQASSLSRRPMGVGSPTMLGPFISSTKHLGSSRSLGDRLEACPTWMSAVTCRSLASDPSPFPTL